MGKKKNQAQGAGVPSNKSFCYWCDKDFEREDVLIQHQISKHFRCPMCNSGGQSGKCINLECLQIHFRKVHRTELLTVPNAKEGRTDPSRALHIYGMQDVPQEILLEWGVNPESAQTQLPAPVPFEMPKSMEAPVSQVPQALTAALGLSGMPSLPTLPGMAPLPVPAAAAAAAAAPGEDSANDLQAQVRAWMDKKREQEAPPPLPKDDIPRQPDFGAQPPRSDRVGIAPATFQGFSMPRGSNVDSAAADAMALFAENAKLSIATTAIPQSAQVVVSRSRRSDALPPDPDEQQPPATAASSESFTQPQFTQPQVRPRSSSRDRRGRSRSRRGRSYDRGRGRSRSRGRRSRSRNGRGRSRSRSRGGNRGRDQQSSYKGSSDKGKGKGKDKDGGKGKDGGKASDGRTIQIIEGSVRSRLQLKGEMEKYGRVETVYMGNRHDPTAEPPMVRFESVASAENALAALAAGQVIFDGMLVKGELKSSGRRPMVRDIESQVDSKLHITSRDLAQQDQRNRANYDDRGGGGGGGRW